MIAAIVLMKIGMAQDVHFSQFYASPLSQNPAFTGHYDADWRVMNNYRNQWRSISIPYQTISVGFDRQFFLHNEKFSGGIFIIHDNSGNASLTVDKVFLSLAYHKKLGKSYWHFGIQGGPVMKTFSMDKLTFPSQWNRPTGRFEGGLPNGEANMGEQIVYADLNFGIIWSKKMRNLYPEIGIAAFHLTMPQESFFGTTNRLPIRSVFHAGLKLDIKDRLYIKPRLMYMGTKMATDLLGGLNLGLYIPQNGMKIRSVFIGGLVRNNFSQDFDAAVGIIGVEFNHLDIGFSYDINISNLKTATSYKGAFEISVIFTSASTLVRKITLPCDRY